MEVQELRVGNHLFKYGEVVKIVEIGIKHKGDTNYYLRSENDNCGYWIDQFNPIPLTEEILLKCGFVKQGFYFLNRNSALMQMEISLSRKCFISSLLAIEIKHLHQLQNLYWCLVGKELEIELCH